MPDELNDIEIRSEEVQDILSKVPHWMVRWGSSLYLGLTILILAISWWVKYPDVIEASVVITSQEPPQKEFARTNGKFDSIYVKDSQLVKKNTLLAVIENTAHTEDVLFLKSVLYSLDIEQKDIIFPINELPILILGDIEPAFASFEDSYTEYEMNKSLLPFSNESLANEASLNELKVRLQNMRSQYTLNESELKLKKNDLQRNRELLEKGVVSQLDYENKQLEVMNTEKQLKTLGASISQIRESMATALKNLKGNEISRTREESKLLRKSFQKLNQLKKAIKDWEYTYVLKSDIEGKVSFLNYWSKNQTVQMGDLVFTIVPRNNKDYLAKMKVAVQNSGKIKTGQRVNIKLRNYPEAEFGMLEGRVSSISQVPNNDGFYLVDVELPEHLVTSYSKEIEFRQEMSGTGEIITEDLRLLERFFYQFKNVLDR